MIDWNRNHDYLVWKRNCMRNDLAESKLKRPFDTKRHQYLERGIKKIHKKILKIRENSPEKLI